MPDSKKNFQRNADILRQSHLRAVDYFGEIIQPEDQSKESAPGKVIGGGEFNRHHRTNVMNRNEGG